LWGRDWRERSSAGVHSAAGSARRARFDDVGLAASDGFGLAVRSEYGCSDFVIAGWKAAKLEGGSFRRPIAFELNGAGSIEVLRLRNNFERAIVRVWVDSG